MGAGYLLDTNTVIDFAAETLPVEAYIKLSLIINENSRISVINQIELLSVVDVPLPINNFVEQVSIILLNSDIVARTISLRKTYKIKLPDAIIAATALVYGLTLISHNTSDFKNIKGLKLIDSYNIP